MELPMEQHMELPMENTWGHTRGLIVHWAHTSGHKMHTYTDGGKTTSHLPAVLSNEFILFNSFFGKAAPPGNLRWGYQKMLPGQLSGSQEC